MVYQLDYELKQLMSDNYRTSQPLTQQWWQQAEMDTKMTVGMQDYWNQIYTVNFRNQRMLQFNKCHRVINLIGGYQRKNRKVSLCVPVHNTGNDTADQLTQTMYWSKTRDDTYEKISECFDGSNMTGFELMNVWMDYREDPESGDINCSRVPYNAFIMDPHWKQRDLSDCDWIWERKYLSAEKILALYPKLGPDLPAIKKGQMGLDGRFLYMPENRQMYNQDLYAYDEYWRRGYKTAKKILDERTGEVIDWPKGMNEDKMSVFKRFNPNIRVIKVQVPTVKLHVLVNDNLVYEEEEPYGISKYPYVPFLSYFNPEVQDYSYRYMGVVRNIRDSQIELNRRRNRMLDIIDSQVNSGLIVKEDALVDPEDAFLQGQGRVFYLKDSATLADIQQIPAPQIPPSMFQLQALLDQEIMNIAGVNEELFGQSDDPTISGFLTQLRMGASLVSLQSIFDGLNHSQKLLGKIWIELIQANFTEGKIKRIIGKQPTDEIKDGNFEKYDCVVEEGVLTSTQKQLQFLQLLQLKQMGVPVPTKMLLESSTLQNKNELIAAITEEEKKIAEQQAAQTLQQMQQQAVMTRSLEAQAQNNFAMAEERKARAVADIGLAKERQSEGIQNRASAALDNARAMKELEQMDESRLMELTRFVVEMQEKQKGLGDTEITESEKEAEEVAEDVTEADEKSKAATEESKNILE